MRRPALDTPAQQCEVDAEPSIRIVIVTYNSASYVAQAIQSIARATTRRVELVVVDNASTDATLEIVRRECPRVRIVESRHNLGFGAGCNVGAGLDGDPELLLLLNPDSELDPTSLDVAIERLTADDSIGALGGRTRYPDGSLNTTCCFARPTLWSALCYATGLASVMRESSFFNPELMGGWDRNDTRDVDVITGCFLLMRTSEFRSLHGFDERFFLYSEDTDLSTRIRASGKRCVHAHDVGLVHVGGGSDVIKAQKLAKVFRARRQYYDKHWPRAAAACGGWLIDLAVATRLVGTLVGDRERRTQWREIWQSRSLWHDGESGIAQELSEVAESDAQIRPPFRGD